MLSSVALPLSAPRTDMPGARTLRVEVGPLAGGAAPAVWRDPRFDRALHRTGPGSFDMRGSAGGFAIHLGGLVVDASVSGSVARACASGIGLWLQLHGGGVVHASAVELDGGVLGFMGPSGRGKSTTAALMVARGCGHVSDEMLVAEDRDGAFSVQPGSPRFRLWPEVAATFGDVSSLEPVAEGARKLVAPLAHVGGGRVCSEPRPLAALVMLERSRDGEGGPTSTRLAPREALRVLFAQSYMGDAADGMGLGGSRFRALAALARRVPVFALRYPSGLDRVDDLVGAVRRIARSVGAAHTAAAP